MPHIVVHSILHVQVCARERSDRYSFAGAMLAGHQLSADELPLPAVARRRITALPVQ